MWKSGIFLNPDGDQDHSQCKFILLKVEMYLRVIIHNKIIT